MSEFFNIEILDDITDWYGEGNFKSVRNKVKAAGKKNINLVVNGYGGSVFEAVMIHNYLKGISAERTVNVHIPAYAMSAHTLIATVGQKVTMADNGYYMIHNPWTMAAGDKNDMESTLSLLEGMTNQLADAYVAKTKMPKKKVLDMMDAETWLTAQEALDLGFVDELTPGAQMKAAFSPDKLKNFTNIPQNIFSQNINEMTPSNTTDQEKSFLDHIKSFFNAQRPEQTDNTDTYKALNDQISDLQARYDAQNQSATDLQATIDGLNAQLVALNTELEELKATPLDSHTAGPAASASDLTPNPVKSYMQGAIYDKLERMQPVNNQAKLF